MNLVVNGELLAADLDRDLDQILSHIDRTIQQLQQNREVVEGIFIDDIDMSADVPGRLKAHLQEAKTIEIRTISEVQFYHNVRSELLHYLPNVIRATESISDLFYGDPTSESWTLFTRLTDSFSYVIQSVNAMQLYLSRNESDSALLNSLQVFVEKMETCLKEVDHSIQSQDYVLLADIIKYELGDILNELLEILEMKAK